MAGIGALRSCLLSTAQLTASFLASARLYSRALASPSFPLVGQNKLCCNPASKAIGSTSGGALLRPDVLNATQTRGRARIFYKGSAWKRVNKHGLEQRLRSKNGVEIIWRRLLKGCHSLTPFDRILPGTVNGKILPAHHIKYNQHLVNPKLREQLYGGAPGKRKLCIKFRNKTGGFRHSVPPHFK